MFYLKTIKNLKQQIRMLQNRIADKERPFKYDIGDSVEFEIQEFGFNSDVLIFKGSGQITQRRWEYDYYMNGFCRINSYIINTQKQGDLKLDEIYIKVKKK